MCNRVVLMSLTIALCANAQGQVDSISFFERSPVYDKSRANLVGYGTGSIYVASMTGLYALWYRNQESEAFHFFNDNKEWLQVDKAGHATTSYYLGRSWMDLMLWAGYSERKATWVGGNLGFVMLTSVEAFDGFSTGWGFSWGDMFANFLGAQLVTVQQSTWHEQRIVMKYSYHHTRFAALRPSLLGSNWRESFLKDYNGQTLWLSMNVNEMAGGRTQIPKWLNLSVGYGGDGMITGSDIAPAELGNTPWLARNRQYYLSLDVDLTRVRTGSGFVDALLHTVNFLKVPAPAIEFNQGGRVKFYPFYF